MPEYLVESGELRWRGNADNENDALDIALSGADCDLGILTRIHRDNAGFWEYIQTEVVLERIGLIVEDEESIGHYPFGGDNK